MADDRSPIFAFADSFSQREAELDPMAATARGVGGFDHLLTDLSPEGTEARADHVRSAVTQLRTLPITDEFDRRASDLMIERFSVSLDAHDSGEWLTSMRPIASSTTALRAVFDLMDRDGPDAWEAIAARLEALPVALDGLRATYELGRTTGRVAARRQAVATARQCATWATNRWFDTLAAEARECSDVGTATRTRINAGAHAANAAFGGFAEYLEQIYAPSAAVADAAGPERYALGVRRMLGADLDPREMYEWAWDDFHLLRADIAATCEMILPGASFDEVVHLLDHDPDRAVHGVDAYRAWLQELTDEALRRAATSFDIPDAMNRCEALIPPEGSAAAAYYTEPSEDFSRPGRTWYPALGRTMFPMWGDVTTCYHESVPGHHLQLAYAKLQSASLCRVQRNTFIPGHGEGWALYAERLCDEDGWFERPEYRLGFLSGQILRTVRVIIDIGMHLGYRIPETTTSHDGTPFHPGEAWTPELAFRFAIDETGNTDAFMASEIDRYLGWPAQAISYKIGEREWLRARDDARQASGSAFDLRVWHTRALALGAMGLAQLRAELSA